MVTGILGVLSAVAVPLISAHLGESKDRAYEVGRERFQQAVDAFLLNGPFQDSFSLTTPDKHVEGGTPMPVAGGLYTGSYSWYMDGEGRVKSLFFFFPDDDKTGFHMAYP